MVETLSAGDLTWITSASETSIHRRMICDSYAKCNCSSTVQPMAWS